MEVVHELIYLLDRYSVRHIDVITNPRTAPDKKESRYHDYYIGIRENRWADDAEAAQAFGIEPDSKNWQRFKNEVKKRVANSLLFIEGNEETLTEYGKALITLTQNWAVAKICLARGAKTSFIEYASKSLEIALKYEFIDNAFEISRALKGSYFVNTDKKKDFLKMNELSAHLREAYMAEVAIKDQFQTFLAPLVDKKGKKLKAASDACSIVASMSIIAKSNNYIVFNHHFRMLDVYSSLLANKWSEALSKTNDALEYLNTKPFKTHSYYSSFLQQKIVCCIMLKEYNNANNSLLEAISLNIEGTFGWFKTLELQTINALYSQNYREAWDTYKLVTKHKLYNINVTPLDKETWRLFYAYLVLLIRKGQIELSPREKGDAEKFRISSWLNDVGTLSLDKQGSNIPVLIFHTVFLFVEDRYDEYLNRMEALRKYKQRNLDPENEHYRTDCFIRLLELLGENHHPKILMGHAEPFLKGLSAVSTDLLDSSFELEVMPYEHQWEWLLEVYTSRMKG